MKLLEVDIVKGEKRATKREFSRDDDKRLNAAECCWFKAVLELMEVAAAAAPEVLYLARKGAKKAPKS